MRKANDLTGMRFGKLVVIKKVPRPESKKKTGAYWRCKCDCGNEIDTYADHLNRGHTKSCGCLHIESAKTTINRFREITHPQNDGVQVSQICAKTNVRNTSGIRGVTWNKQCGKYVAYISYAKRQYCLGHFPDLESAAKARKEAEELLYKPLLNS